MATRCVGQRKVEGYLSGNISLFALDNWSLEFGDEPRDGEDLDSMEIAGLVTELVADLGNGTITEQAIRERSSDVVQQSAT